MKALFKDLVSSGAFKTIDGEMRIIGKFGQISMIDDVIDCWLVTDPPMSKRKLGAALKKSPLGASFRVLDGEAYYQTTDKSLIPELITLAGIRKKRILSDKQREAARINLSKTRI